jgi:hypothetical protein
LVAKPATRWRGRTINSKTFGGGFDGGVPEYAAFGALKWPEAGTLKETPIYQYL